MNAVKGIFKDGIVELIDAPGITNQTEVLVIFPDKKKNVRKIRGLYKNALINYDDIENELKTCNSLSEKEILKDMKY